MMTDAFNYFLPVTLTALSRDEAMSVPSVARCRNLIAGTIATFPLELYKKSTGEKLGKPIWIDQPAAAQPRSVTLAWTVDSLLFYGVAYWRVTEVYFDDGRPARFEWIAPGRVSFDTDPVSEYIYNRVKRLHGAKVANSTKALDEEVEQTDEQAPAAAPKSTAPAANKVDDVASAFNDLFN